MKNLKGGVKVYGVTLHAVQPDFDPTMLVAQGHISPVRFVAACSAYLRVEWGWRNMLEGRTQVVLSPTLLDALEDVRYTHGLFLTEETDDPGDPCYNWDEFDWYLTWPEEPGSAGSEPITIWSI